MTYYTEMKAGHGGEILRDEGCCSLNFLKYVFVIFNTLFILSGVVLSCAGFWTYYTHYDFLLVMSSPTYSIITWSLVGIGAVVMLVGIIGCAGVHLESERLIAAYSFFILLVLFMDTFLGMVSYIYYEQVARDLHMNLAAVFQKNYAVNHEETVAIDFLQHELSCCGGISFSDWRQSRWFTSASGHNLVPDSCCKSYSPGCGRRDHPSNIPYTGCIHPMEHLLRSRLVILGALGVSCAAFQLLGLVYSLALFCRLKVFKKRLRKRADGISKIHNGHS